MPNFEFDPDKSAANKDRHGIDFTEAEKLWADLDRIEIPARTEDEARLALIARWQDKVWTAIFTMRGERVRLISVRRARPKERKLYYEGD